jgi:hypothetical protein
VHGTGTVARVFTEGEAPDGVPGPGLVVHIRELTVVEAAPASVVPPPVEPDPAETGGGPRYRLRIPARWGGSLPPSRMGLLSNENSSGAFVLAAEELAPEGERIHVEFDLPGGQERVTVRAEATVVWTTEVGVGDMAGMALAFERAAEGEDAVTRFLLGPIAEAMIGRLDSGETETETETESESESETESERMAAPTESESEPVSRAPAARTPWASRDMTSARIPAKAEEQRPDELLEKLSNTIATGGSERMRSTTKILVFAMAAVFMLYLIKHCMGAVE